MATQLSLEELKAQALNHGFKLTKIRPKKEKEVKEPERPLYVVRKGKSFICIEGQPSEKEVSSLITKKGSEIKVLANCGIVKLPEPESDSEEEKEN